MTTDRACHFAELNAQLTEPEQERLLSRVRQEQFPLCQLCLAVPITKFMDPGCGAGHGACANCLQAWHADYTTRLCPLGCGTDVTMPNGGYTREFTCRNEWLDSQEILCPREGCNFTGTAISITSHLTSECEYRRVSECPNWHKGCSHTVAIGIPWHEMKSGHCAQVCTKRAAKCPFADCDWKGNHDELEDHLDEPHAGAVQQYMRQMNERQRKNVAELTSVKSELTSVKSELNTIKAQLAPLVELMPMFKTFLEVQAPALVAGNTTLVDKVAAPGGKKRAAKWAPDAECEPATRRRNKRQRRFMGFDEDDYASWLAVKKGELVPPNPNWKADMAAATATQGGGAAADDDDDE